MNTKEKKKSVKTFSVENIKNYFSGLSVNPKILTYTFWIVLLYFGINSIMELATDTYATFEEAGTWQWMLYENGRVINGLIYYVIEAIGLSGGIIYYLSYAAALFFLYLALVIIAHVLLQYQENAFFCVLLATVTVVNPFFIEYFLFIEKGLFMFAIFCNAVAFGAVAYFFLTKKKKALLLAALSLLLAVFIYQVTLGLFVILCLPLILKHTKNAKDFFTGNLLVAGLYGSNLLLAFLVTKFCLKSSRMGGISNIFENLRVVLNKVVDISTGKFFQLNDYYRFILLVFAVILLCIFLEKKPVNAWILPAYIYLTAGCIIVSFFPYIMGVYGAYESRIIYPYGCILGMLLIWCTLSLNPAKTSKQLLLVLLCFLAFWQYRNYQDIFIERYKCNQADRYLCEIIGNEIKDYESETGIEIKTICYYKDQVETWADHGFHTSELNVRAQSCGWSKLNAMNYYLDKDYVMGDSLDEYTEYFGQFNWDTYADEQLIFEGDTLHICSY